MTKSKQTISQLMYNCVLRNDSEFLARLTAVGEAKTSLDRTDILKLSNGIVAFESLDEITLYKLYQVFAEFYPENFGTAEEYFEDSVIGVANSDMVHQDRKREFLEELSRKLTEREYLDAFRSMQLCGEKMESLLNKDLCDMSFDEVQVGLSNLALISQSALRMMIKHLRLYIKWCREKSFLKSRLKHPIEIIDTDDVSLTKAIEINVVRDPAALVELIEVVRPLDMGYLIVPILGLAWLGLEAKHMVDLRNEDVDLTECVVRPKGMAEIRDIPPEILQALRLYRQTDTSTRMRYGIQSTVFADDIGFFLKKMLPVNSKFYGSRISKFDINNAVSAFADLYRRNAKIDKKISISNINLSGHLYRLFNREAQGEELTRAVFMEEFSIKNTTSASSNINYKRRVYEAYCSNFYSSN